MAAKSRPVAVNPETPGAFAELLPDVTPLPAANRALVERELPAPIPEQRLRDEQQALADSLSDEDAWEAGLETGEELQFLRDNLSRDVLRKLRRGHWLIQNEIDLHGLTVAEALWKKKPVVASAVGGIPTQVLHKQTGLLAHSVEGTAYQIRFLLSHPDIAQRLGEQGHEHVRENFLITSNLKGYLTLFLHFQS